jgi:hypothetical protein
MGFREDEYDAQTRFKGSHPDISNGARAQGTYKGKEYGFCLPVACSAENLWSGHRTEAIELYKMLGIPWHDGINGASSNHMCDSQASCINFLLPFATRPAALLRLIKPHVPEAVSIVPITEGRLALALSFEWIGKRNYLKERSTSPTRQRGAHNTSVDAVFRCRLSDGRLLVVLVEWKYTERYSSTSYLFSPSGTYRPAIYAHLLNEPWSPINPRALEHFNDLFYEPFYQLFRHQALGAAMESAGEMGADIVCLWHIAPSRNRELLRVTSPGLKTLGSDVYAIWNGLLREPDRFKSISTGQLFAPGKWEADPELAPWWAYVSQRYTGMLKTS